MKFLLALSLLFVATQSYGLDASGLVNVKASELVGNVPTNVISEVDVTQHQGALSIDESQISDLRVDFMCELSITNDSTEDTVTATAEAISDWGTNFEDASFTASSTSIIVSNAGRYLVSCDLSFSTATAADVTVEIHTNSVAAADSNGQNAGFRRDTSASLNNGVVTFSRTYDFPSACTTEVVVATSADETITWEYGTLRVEKR